MRKGTKSDKETVINIILDAFDNNPSVNWVVKDDHKKEYRFKELASYAFETALARDGILLSDDETGIALIYQFNFKKESLIDYWNQLKLAIKAIGLARIPMVLKRQAYINSQRPKSSDFLYFWFFGVNSNGKGQGAAYELQKAIYKESKDKNLPIYLETSIRKNRIVYERYGFETYHTWKVEEQGLELWFMKRMPQ